MEVDVHTPELVATGFDGSPAGVAALAWAAAEATARRRQPCVYHCWQQPVLTAATVPGTFPPMDRRIAENAAAATLREATGWLARHHPAVAVTADTLEGAAGRCLAAHVRRGDQLVLGMSSRHRFTARLLGSTIEHVLRHARCTVVVVPPTHDSGGGPFGGHVVAAVDGSESTSAVVGAGFAEAAAHGRPLTVVHALGGRHPIAGRPAGTLEPEIDQPVVNAAIESWHAGYPHVVVHRATVDGPPAAGLEQATAGAMLVVVGQSRHPLRPVRLVDHLLSRLGCPVAIVPLPVGAAEADELPQVPAAQQHLQPV